MDLPDWVIPAAEFDMGKEGWVPVPSFIYYYSLPAGQPCLYLAAAVAVLPEHVKAELLLAFASGIEPEIGMV
jgi:hypothetical protein